MCIQKKKRLKQARGNVGGEKYRNPMGSAGQAIMSKRREEFAGERGIHEKTIPTEEVLHTWEQGLVEILGERRRINRKKLSHKKVF